MQHIINYFCRITALKKEEEPTCQHLLRRISRLKKKKNVHNLLKIIQIEMYTIFSFFAYVFLRKRMQHLHVLCLRIVKICYISKNVLRGDRLITTQRLY